VPGFEIHGAYVDQETISCLPPTVTEFGVSGDGGLHKGIGGQLEALRIQYIPWESYDIYSILQQYNSYGANAILNATNA
jgi:hypothetical protein